MKIVLLESLAIAPEHLETYAQALRQGGHTFEAYERSADPAVQIERVKDADILILANMPLSGEVIRACKQLKFINVAFTGVDHIDLAACREMGVQVSNASGYSTQSVAELALGLMLALLRNVPQVDARCRSGQTKDGLVGCELSGKTVGIVGLGAIGQRTAALCHAFGCRIIAFNPRPKQAADYIEQLPLHDVLAQSDILSLHCPLKDDTRGLIGQAELAQMKKSALLINTARGPVVDSAALAEALNSGNLAGAGIDVFESEPPLNPQHPLLSAKNTIVTPHVAFATRESMLLRAKIVFETLDAYLHGERRNVIL
jgi:phosphoglycerate dehydrogenase-like enzyme